MLKSVLSVLVPEISMIENIDITNENIDLNSQSALLKQSARCISYMLRF